jgi:serine protease Do
MNSMISALMFLAAPMMMAQVAWSDDASTSALNALSDAFSKVAEETSSAVVFIQVEKEMDQRRMAPGGPMMPDDLFEYFFGHPNGGDPRGRDMEPGQRPGRGGKQPSEKEGKRSVPYGQGTGFIVSQDGFILTNNHVVGDADKVKVKLADGREFTAQKKGTDPQTEIALIKIDATGLPTVPLGDSDKIRVGEWVVAIGNPFGLSHTVTTGIVSAKSRGNVGIADYADFIQTDAAINPGNSGGPLLNLKGEVIGMNTAILSRTGGSLGIGFAIPVNMLKYVEAQLMDKGAVTRGFLGVNIQNLNGELAKHFGLKDTKGALVADTTKGSPADKAGIQRDDVIVEFDGQPVDEVGSFRSRVSTTMPGKKVDLVVLRNGERKTLSVEVGTLSKEDEAHMSGGEAGESAQNLGITVQNLSDELAKRFGYEGEKGALISEIEQGSAAEEAGLKEGQLIQEVNRKPVASAEEFDRAVKEAGKEGVLLRVRDGKYSRYVALKTN